MKYAISGMYNVHICRWVCMWLVVCTCV